MGVRTVLRMGDPRLLRVSEPVTRFGTNELHALVADMWDTMRATDGVGIAAPQIGVALRVVVFGIEANPRYPDARPVPETVLVNPILTALTEELEEGWEGCLSVPGLRGAVSRPGRIRYHGFDAQGTPIDRAVDGFHARAVQHEVDHLDGILYPMRITDMRKFGFRDVLSAGIAPDDCTARLSRSGGRVSRTENSYLLRQRVCGPVRRCELGHGILRGCRGARHVAGAGL